MSAAVKQKPVLSLRGALRERFKAPEWAYFEEVRNGTGWSRSITRTADALAFGLWPSRGLELHGIEIKSDRGDWKREIADPSKAEEIGRFCDRWWLVTEEKVAHIEEIPPAWGWLVFTGKRLKMEKEAPKREALPIDRAMLAAILRKASEGIDDVVRASVNERVAAEMDNEREANKQQQERLTSECSEWYGKYNRASGHLHHFASAFGFDASADELPGDLLEKLKSIDTSHFDAVRNQMEEAVRHLRRAALTARSALRAAGVRPKLHAWERRR